MRTSSSCNTCRSRKKRCTSSNPGRPCDFCISKGFRCDRPSSRKYHDTRQQLQHAINSPDTTEGAADADPSLQIVPKVLADSSLCDELISSYFELMHFAQQILFHPPSFLHEYKRGLAPGYLVLGIIAMAARFSSNSVFDSLPPNSRAKPFLRQAMRAFNDREELVSIEALQGCMLLQFCAFVECDANQDALLSCQAIRMAQLLRLLMMQNIDRIAQEVETNVYWQVWMLDCWNSVRAEIPRQLTDRTGFPKPLQEDLFYSIPAAESTQDWAFESTRELSVWGKIIPLTEYHAQTVKLNYDIVHDPAFNFRNISLVRDISSKLDSWLRKLPPTLHNTAENLAAYTNRGFGRTFAEMHLTYHHTSQSLYYQFLNRYVDRNDASSAIIDEEAQTYVELCRSHATALSKLMWSLHSSSDLDCLWTPVNGNLLVIASTVHLHTMLLGSSSPEINIAKKLLEQNFLILQELERYWPLINIAFSRLHAFHHACQTRDASKAFNMDHWMGIFLNQFDIPMDNRGMEANISKDLNMYLPAQSVSPESTFSNSEN